MIVDQAIRQVDREYYVLQENGEMLPQTTATEAIRQHLQFLEVQEGQHVLEIGTGSGYSTALLATLVGQNGMVTSIDIDPKITQRARLKLANFPWVNLITGDGRNGSTSDSLYDRIIAWTSAKYLPNVWGEQLAEEGLIVAPFRVLPIADSMVMVRLKKTNGM